MKTSVNNGHPNHYNRCKIRRRIPTRAQNRVTLQRKAGKCRKLPKNHKTARRKKQGGKIPSAPITIWKSIKKGQLFGAVWPQTHERFSYNSFSIFLFFEFPTFSWTNRNKLAPGSFSDRIPGSQASEYRGIKKFFSINTFFKLNFSKDPQRGRGSGGPTIFQKFLSWANKQVCKIWAKSERVEFRDLLTWRGV